MLKGGVIMDVLTPERTKIAEDAGAVAVMAKARIGQHRERGRGHQAHSVAAGRHPEAGRDRGGRRLVIPGGASTTRWRLAAAFEPLDPVRKLIVGGLPVFGSWAGLIMLADRLEDGADGQQTLGGLDLTARRNAFGRQVDSFERDVTLRLDGEGEVTSFHAAFIRAPEVAQAALDVCVLGADNGRIIAVRQGVLLATAFHPELTPDRRIHEYFVSMVKGTS